MNKYNAQRHKIDGITFDSKKELERYIELKALQDKGLITELEIHKPYVLIPSQYVDGKLVERAVKYFADFSYKVNGGEVVEDVKGCRHSVAYNLYVIKRKLMLERYGIRVREI